MKKYIVHIIAAVLFLIVIILTVKSCNNPVLPDNEEKIKELEKSEQHFRELADSLSKNIQIRIDTFTVYKTKIKIKNDTIYVQQAKVGGLTADSSYKFFSAFTGSVLIRD